jgi:hypothetical protein
MNDVLLAILATVVAPAITGFVTYLVTRRKDLADMRKSSAESNGVSADTAGKYRGFLNEEIDRRRRAENELDQYEDACRELSEENMKLREQVRDLKDRLRKAGINADTKPI